MAEPSPERIELIYEGPADGVSLLAHLLGQAGLTASYEAPIQRRGVGADVHTIVIAVVAGTVTKELLPASKAVVARFREHFPHAKVRGRHEAL